MPLTGKQKRVLRSLGQLLDPVIHLGKEGVSEAAVAATEDAFRRRELLKVRVLKNAPDAADALAQALAGATGSELAGRVGQTVLLYRPNPELPERIVLPPARTAS
jgi:RNA-binding protein